MKLPHERLVTGGLVESHFVFALGTKHHGEQSLHCDETKES